MEGAPQIIEPDEVHRLLLKALAEFEEPAEIRSDGVWLSKWPSVRFSIDRAIVFPSTSEAWTAWIDVTCMYNTTLPFTAARAHVIGLGRERAAATFDAIENWRNGVAPALISYIYGFLKGDADTWPPDHERSVPGWNCINGPYVLRGNLTETQTLTTFLQQHPLVGPVREHLGLTLDKSAPLHTVSLYRAQTSAGAFADVLIDNQQDVVAGELLKLMSWPQQLDGSQLVSARHFLLCIDVT